MSDKQGFATPEKWWVIGTSTVTYPNPMTDRQINELRGEFKDTIPAYSLDELLQTKEARERNVVVGVKDEEFAVWYDARVKPHLTMQQALDFIAELISQEAPCQK